MPDSIDGESTRRQVFGPPYLKHDPAQIPLTQPRQKPPAPEKPSDTLSTDVATQLLALMKAVTKEVNPQTVNAACNCASEIHKILTLGFKMGKIR